MSQEFSRSPLQTFEIACYYLIFAPQSGKFLALNLYIQHYEKSPSLRVELLHTMVKVLFVCMGNICRSPTAEGVFSHLVRESNLQEKIHIDSAGTHAYHIGEPPDSRAQAAARQRRIDLSPQRARKVKSEDLDAFDYVLAMDQGNFADLEAICPAGQEHKLRLFLDFANRFEEREVPDPYYGGDQGFEHVLNLVEDASLGLLTAIRTDHKL